MLRSGLFPPSLQIAICVTSLMLMTSCGKKAQIQYEAAQARTTMLELQTQVKKLEADIQGVGPLARYGATQKGHVSELKAQIQRLKLELDGLNAEKASAKSKVDALKGEIEAYRAKYRAA